MIDARSLAERLAIFFQSPFLASLPEDMALRVPAFTFDLYPFRHLHTGLLECYPRNELEQSKSFHHRIPGVHHARLVISGLKFTSS